ncbi:sugar transferase [Hyphomicrobium sp. ghe19]|uniref:sugar transferase n=1 Tax=Hyphomicrobium sp. ghe19 TaxID=2682968 RepID=UPI0013670902|nr:Undecaprenyl phosphate N,N'-diacetylbacillosamine 1-phosphate transferase [Hyphomicrobium sp. ghe19]
MRRLIQLFCDLFLVVLATIFASILRDNFDVSRERQAADLVYILCTIGVASVVIPSLGLDRSIWRLSALPDYLRIVGASVVIVVGAVALGFTINRLDGVARALPILQCGLIIFGMVGVRVLMRLRYVARGRPAQFQKPIVPGAAETVLIIGMTRLTELYLRSVAEFGNDRVRVAGILGSHDRHLGRLVLRHQILGTPENVVEVVQRLSVHGVAINRLVITQAFDALAQEVRDALLHLEKTTIIVVDFIGERLGFERVPTGNTRGLRVIPDGRAAFAIDNERLSALMKRPYWRFKRLIDIAVAAALLVLLAPIMVVVAALVAVEVGFPVVFWQQRPGVGGIPFCMYKFRSMRAEHSVDGQKLSEVDRITFWGGILRRTRLDELPQLYNILAGEMSFVGPRPLLPVDQPAEYVARLMIRPGLTGCAQVEGGRDISAADKAALDVWYLKNASFKLDIRILWQTFGILVFGERVNTLAIARAWRDLRRSGFCQNPAETDRQFYDEVSAATERTARVA